MAAWLLSGSLAIALAPASGGEESFRPLQIGERIPAVTVPNLAGGLIAMRAGEPLTLLNVWATWCGPCRQEFPELQNIQNRYHRRGLRVVAVSIDTGGRAAVRRFVASRHVTFLIGHDANGTVPRTLQTVGVPETFLIGADGRLLWHQAGALRNGAADARAAIDAALAPAQPRRGAGFFIFTSSREKPRSSARSPVSKPVSMAIMRAR